VALALGGCAAEPRPTGGPDPAAAEAACAAATAEHVARPVEAVAAAWAGPTADGGGSVRVTDQGGAAGERVHLCTLRADGSLAALEHAAS
jgi:hypothetical protein